MRRKGTVVRGAAGSFYDKREGKKPVLLYILPILMVLVILVSFYLAYQDSMSQSDDGSSAEPTSSSVLTDV